MFFLWRPSHGRMALFHARQRSADLSYSHPLTGYAEDHNQIRLGDGEDVFSRARRAVQDWHMFRTGWIQLHPERPPIEPGSVVVVAVNHFGFWSLNACRIVSVIDEPRRYGFVYGTLQDHAERGEERFSVEWRADGSVWYDILAHSQPHHPLARLARPIARRMQRRFAEDSKSAMMRAVS